MEHTAGIAAISFDGDGTLWDFEAAMRQALGVTLQEMRRRVGGRAAGELTVDRMIEIRNAVADELRNEPVSLEEIRRRAFRRTVQSVGCRRTEIADDLSALYFRHRFDDIPLYPDVIPALDALRAAFCIGLLTNGNSYPDRCGLPGYFQFILLAQDVGVEKPDPAMFLAACREARCPPRQLVHVGDSLQTDVAGANGIGATSVWLNRARADNGSEIQPDHEIHSLAELTGIVCHGARAFRDSAPPGRPGDTGS